MTPQRILLLEDDPNLGVIVKEHLEMNAYDVTLCVNGVEGTEAIRQEKYDLCLVDIMMPKKDGFSFARELRQNDSRMPLIFLTAKSLHDDKIEGFKIGCDDYLTKPFSMEELLLRIQAVLRRSESALDPDGDLTVVTLGNFEFDVKRQVLKLGDSDRKLTPKEADLLRVLCRYKNRLLPRETALREVWGNESYFSGRSMDVFISKLRKYLSLDPHIEILGVHGKGFRLMVHDE